jgi:hypothetical protein
MKVQAVLLYLSGISMHRIAFLLRVSAQSVLNWLRTFAQEHYEKPEPTGKAIILELDEMWHYLKNKRRKLWIWKALDPDTGQLLAHGSLILKPVSNIVDNPLILHTIVQHDRDCKARVWANGASGAHCPQNSQI